MLKEVTRLKYLDSPMTDVLAPMSEVLFILTNNPSPRCEWLWISAIPIP